MGRTSQTIIFEISEKIISTHSPRVGRTAVERHFDVFRTQFQLTRPVWGEPCCRLFRYTCRHYFNSLAPCGANPSSYPCASSGKNFNSLAPCGANLCGDSKRNFEKHFNSLAPCGANQTAPAPLVVYYVISTHSPRVGRTDPDEPRAADPDDFNSLAPCGANL